MSDPVNHPAHYTQGKIEVIEAIEDWKLPYHLSNAIKYIARSPHKGNMVQDLQKAVWYLERYIELTMKEMEERLTAKEQIERDENRI